MQRLYRLYRMQLRIELIFFCRLLVFFVHELQFARLFLVLPLLLCVYLSVCLCVHQERARELKFVDEEHQESGVCLPVDLFVFVYYCCLFMIQCVCAPIHNESLNPSFYVYIYMYTYTRVCICIYKYIHTYTHTRTHTHTRAHTHTHTHTHNQFADSFL